MKGTALAMEIGILLGTAALLAGVIASLVAGFIMARKKIRPIWQRLIAGEEEIRKLHNELLDLKRFKFGLLYSERFRGWDPVPFTAQHGEDFRVLELANGKRDGIFVDIGAYDGVSLSNTYALEKLGWRGIRVEANPEKASECAENRPHCHVVNAAVGGRAQQVSLNSR